MNLLVLHPGKIPETPEKIGCFSDVWSYYLPRELRKHVKLDLRLIPATGDLAKWAKQLDVAGYDAIIALGLRYFSTVPTEVGKILQDKIAPGFLCQIHDGSRLDNDPVDITFTLKDDSSRYPFDSSANRYVRHHAYNEYIGWAADPDLNFPQQDNQVLRILVDHTNYGLNPIDQTKEILLDIKQFVESKMWYPQFQSVVVRRFDSGCVVDVDFTSIKSIEQYDRTSIPLPTICQEHSAAHVFCVTHPESVGLVVLETAMAGALTVTPKGFIPQDRLATVVALEYEQSIDWPKVLENINPEKSREVALQNSWESVAKRIRSALWIRSAIRGKQ